MGGYSEWIDSCGRILRWSIFTFLDSGLWGSLHAYFSSGHFSVEVKWNGTVLHEREARKRKREKGENSCSYSYHTIGDGGGYLNLNNAKGKMVCC